MLRRFQRGDDKLGAHSDELAGPYGSRKHSCLLHEGLVTRLHGLYMGCALGWSKFQDTSFPSPASNRILTKDWKAEVELGGCEPQCPVCF